MELINGEIMHAQHPATFEIPERAARENLRPGALAKIDLTDGSEGERFWCQITKRLPGHRYRASVPNELCFFDLRYGAPIEFGAEHVLSVNPPTAPVE